MQKMTIMTASASSAPSVYPSDCTAFFTLCTMSGVRISKMRLPRPRYGWNSLLMSSNFPSKNLKEQGDRTPNNYCIRHVEYLGCFFLFSKSNKDFRLVILNHLCDSKALSQEESCLSGSLRYKILLDLWSIMFMATSRDAIPGPILELIRGTNMSLCMEPF